MFGLCRLDLILSRFGIRYEIILTHAKCLAMVDLEYFLDRIILGRVLLVVGIDGNLDGS